MKLLSWRKKIPFKYKLLLITIVLSLIYFYRVPILDTPKSGVYLGSDGQEYEIDSTGPTFISLKGTDNLLIYFNILKSDPDEHGNMNLKGRGDAVCNSLGKCINWTGVYSLKQKDRFQFTKSNGDSLEIIYADK